MRGAVFREGIDRARHGVRASRERDLGCAGCGQSARVVDGERVSCLLKSQCARGAPAAGRGGPRCAKIGGFQAFPVAVLSTRFPNACPYGFCGAHGASLRKRCLRRGARNPAQARPGSRQADRDHGLRRLVDWLRGRAPPGEPRGTEQRLHRAATRRIQVRDAPARSCGAWRRASPEEACATSAPISKCRSPPSRRRTTALAMRGQQIWRGGIKSLACPLARAAMARRAADSGALSSSRGSIRRTQRRLAQGHATGRASPGRARSPRGFPRTTRAVARYISSSLRKLGGILRLGVRAPPPRARDSCPRAWRDRRGVGGSLQLLGIEAVVRI